MTREQVAKLCTVATVVLAGALLSGFGRGGEPRHDQRTSASQIADQFKGDPTLLHGAVPHGPAFVLGASQPYRVHSRIYVDLRLRVENERAHNSALAVSAEESGALAWMAGGCQPGRYIIFYGHLQVAGETVLARTSSGTHPFQRVPIPVELGLGGTVVDAVLAERPSELLVRSATGRIAWQHTFRFPGDSAARCYQTAGGNIRKIAPG
jgi:hypothetical protein